MSLIDDKFSILNFIRVGFIYKKLSRTLFKVLIVLLPITLFALLRNMYVVNFRWFALFFIISLTVFIVACLFDFIYNFYRATVLIDRDKFFKKHSRIICWDCEYEESRKYIKPFMWFEKKGVIV